MRPSIIVVQWEVQPQVQQGTGTQRKRDLRFHHDRHADGNAPQNDGIVYSEDALPRFREVELVKYNARRCAKDLQMPDSHGVEREIRNH